MVTLHHHKQPCIERSYATLQDPLTPNSLPYKRVPKSDQNLSIHTYKENETLPLSSYI